MKKTLLLLIIVFSINIAFSQTTDTVIVSTSDTTYQQESQKQDTPKQQKVEPKKKSKASLNKVFFGGSLGLSFGSYTSIRVYPMIGYKLTPKLSTGVKFMYEYAKHSSSSNTYNNYGGSIFARYRIIPQIYVHAEYNYMNYQGYNYLNEGYRYAVPYLFVGGGFVQRIGKNSYAYAEILFDVLNDSNSPYNEWNPFYSVGVSVGF